ncbi:gene transfer agent family protein [Paracoccus yeei]|uniref:Gene transfer agent family protein n=1 Tax=Paracoccus yeei TaxID=147645 RepID=A0A1V0GW66_9RHOB|nr:gene transfer agent family protein [Paracoccus yeei]ARC37899.1 gene transfer agent family protein [Paracoccus yeei]QEU08772.1 gene transfer agent family protein [Paracoccus yeei]
MRAIIVRWPGGEHPFFLGLADLEVVQENTDCGPEFLLRRISAGQWRVADLMEVLRNGLIGGGMDEAAARKVVWQAAALHPMISFKVPAQTVLSACLFGPPDDTVGEDIPGGPTPADEKTGDGSSAPITGLAP